MIKEAHDAIARQSPMDWVKNAAAILGVMVVLLTGAKTLFTSLDDIQDVEASVSGLEKTLEEFVEGASRSLDDHRQRDAHPKATTAITLLDHKVVTLSARADRSEANYAEILKQLQALRVEVSRLGAAPNP